MGSPSVPSFGNSEAFLFFLFKNPLFLLVLHSFGVRRNRLDDVHLGGEPRPRRHACALQLLYH
jgi:hypothetical protein